MTTLSPAPPAPSPTDLPPAPDVRPVVPTARPSARTALDPDVAPKLGMRGVNIYYGTKRAVRDVDLTIPPNAVTAFIGPSGCGKSTILRCFNRMNDLIPSARVEGEVLFNGEDISARDVQPVAVRQRIG